MKTLEQIKGKIKWKRPDPASQHDEVAMQLQMLSAHPKIEQLPDDVKKELEHLKNLKMYEKAVNDAKVKKIKPSKCKHIDNHTFDEGSWADLDPKKKKNIEADFKKGESHMPILLQNKDTKKRWLLSGNTRLTFNSQIRKKKTPCLIIKY